MDKESSERHKESHISMQVLIELLQANKPQEFKEKLYKKKEAKQMINFNFNAESDTSSTMLQYCCSYGYHDLVDILLAHGADPNAASNSQKHCLLEVARKGNHEVLQVLKDTNAINFAMTHPEKGFSVLHYILEKDYDDAIEKDFEKCFDILMTEESNEEMTKQIKNIINKRDRFGNTPLHLATEKWDQNTVRKLLEFGSNIDWKEASAYLCDRRKLDDDAVIVVNDFDCDTISRMLSCFYTGII